MLVHREVLTAENVAQLIQDTEATVERWRRKGLIHASIRSGGGNQWYARADAFVAQCCRCLFDSGFSLRVVRDASRRIYGTHWLRQPEAILVIRSSTLLLWHSGLPAPQVDRLTRTLDLKRAWAKFCRDLDQQRQDLRSEAVRAS